MIARNKDYLQFIRQQTCCVTGQTHGVIAHHVRLNNKCGIGIKPSDYYTIPLSSLEHARLHAMGEKAYYSLNWINPDYLICVYMMLYCDKKGMIKTCLHAIEELIINIDNTEKGMT